MRAGASSCAANFAGCFTSRCCSSERSACFRMPEKQYAQCRPFPSGRLLPSGVLTSCVETPQWECPGWWVTAAATTAHQPTNSTSAPDQRGLKLRSEQATKARLLRNRGPKLRVPWAKTDMDDPYTRRCLVTLTRKWLETPSSLSRPWFETSFESNWPSTATARRCGLTRAARGSAVRTSRTGTAAKSCRSWTPRGIGSFSTRCLTYQSTRRPSPCAHRAG